ncbi:MAG TPA: hypothetical protein VG826_08190 [Pirellulales bacterium]|nr:hypothetical protein [Pirellulales bacterium]
MGGIIGRSSRDVSWIATCFLATAFFLVPKTDQAADSTLADLADIARTAKPTPDGVAARELNASRERLREATNRLDQYLRSGGANGAAWKRYLHFPELLAAAQPGPTASDEALASLLRRFRANHVGLELPVFQQVAEALEQYRAAVRRQAEPAATDVAQKLDELATRLTALGDPAQPEQLSEIGRVLGWLSDRGENAELVQLVRRRLSQPNLHVYLSQEMIGAGSLRVIKNRPLAVRDLILGTRILGSGRTSGWARTRLLPDSSRGMFETSVVATNQARTVGYNGPARIGSDSTTQLFATKRFYLDGTGFHVWSAKSSAEAHTQVYGIWSNKHGLMDRVVRKVATKRLAQQQRQAERIAARHAEVQMNGKLDAEANAQLGRAHAEFTSKFRNPLLRMAQWPRHLRVSTTDSQFRLTALHDAPARLASAIRPPAVPDNVAMVVQVHESMVNNYGDGLLAGQTIRQEQLDRLSLDLFGRRPPQLAHDEEKGPWSITFSSREPVLLRVNGGKASLTIRGRRFASELRTIDTPLDVTAHYRLLRENNAAKAVREGELEVYPTGFVPDGGRKMSLRQSRDANFVRHRFDDFFTPEIVSQGLVLPGQWGHAGRLDLVELNADQGWVTLAWRMEDGQKETGALGSSDGASRRDDSGRTAAPSSPAGKRLASKTTRVDARQ